MRKWSKANKVRKHASKQVTYSYTLKHTSTHIHIHTTHSNKYTMEKNSAQDRKGKRKQKSFRLIQQWHWINNCWNELFESESKSIYFISFVFLSSIPRVAYEMWKHQNMFSIFFTILSLSFCLLLFWCVYACERVCFFYVCHFVGWKKVFFH